MNKFVLTCIVSILCGTAQAHDAFYDTGALNILHKLMHCYASDGTFIVHPRGHKRWFTCEGTRFSPSVDNQIQHQTLCDYLHSGTDREYPCNFEMIPFGD